MIGRRHQSAGRLISPVIDAFSLIFMLIVPYAIWPEQPDIRETKGCFGVPGIFTATWWPIKLACFLFACLCAAHFTLWVIFRPHDPLGSEAPAEDTA